MIDCNNLLHPFQNDPGVSQHQRIMDDLLSGPAKIDGRNMADLLDYFVQLSRHIYYYDAKLNTSDWQPFFQQSLPFALAAIIKYDRAGVTNKVEDYTRIFEKRPSGAGLQLLIHYIFHQLIDRINTWYLQLKDSALPAELVLLKLIKDQLRAPLLKFICYHNVAVRTYCIKSLHFLPLLQNEVWELDATILHNTDCRPEAETKRKRLIALYDQTQSLVPAFLDAIRVVGATAALCMEQSLFPLQEELQKQHTPHLALLFAFLKLFQHLQADLNTFTKKHLDFFYKEVLKLKAEEAVPDKTHLVIDIQKQLNRYLLKKGLLAKDGKDNNKAEILFSLDDEIVVNKTQVADKRTLFLNNKKVYEKAYLEGVYMAPDAGKADGISKPFKNDSQSFSTLGARLSKYTDPEKSLPQPFPSARLGFILASPVLLLNEGKRTIDITLACELKDNFCDELSLAQTPDNNCCEETDPNSPERLTAIKTKYEEMVESKIFYEAVRTTLESTFYYISENLVEDAVKKGLSKNLEDKLRELLTETKTKNNSPICYCPVKIAKYEAVLNQSDWDTFYNTVSSNEKKILDIIFKPLKPLNIFFSGEKEWISPASLPSVVISPSLTEIDGRHYFVLKISAALTQDQPAVTFYDKEKLNEDFDTSLPVVKFELNEKIKLLFSPEQPDGQRKDNCCLLKPAPPGAYAVSLYHFFRNVIVVDEINGERTRIDVSVCGLKNLIVQNDESIQDVNAPIYPFGTRPKVPGFTKTCCITQGLIDDAVLAGISPATKNYLVSILGTKTSHCLSGALESFLNTIPNPADKPILSSVFNDPMKSYCKRDVAGPNFYIGSKEVFSKNWQEIYVNTEWKDKPADFGVYYKHYSYKNTTFEDGSKEIVNSSFLTTAAVLDNGRWMTNGQRRLFKVIPGEQGRTKPLPPDFPPVPTKAEVPAAFCDHGPIPAYTDIYDYSRNIFQDLPDYERRKDLLIPLAPYNVTAQYGFLRFTLTGVSFQHDIFPFVLTRQLMAYAGLLSLDVIQEMVAKADQMKKIIVAMISDISAIKQHIGHIGDDLTTLNADITTINSELQHMEGDLNQALALLPGNPGGASAEINNALSHTANIREALDSLVSSSDIQDITNDLQAEINQIKHHLSDDPFPPPFNPDNAHAYGLERLSTELSTLIDFFVDNLQVDPELKDGLPSEPYTPIIKSISLDYTAVAEKTDIDLIHLYPYPSTYKHEKMTLQPALFPTFCDEGNLFLGLRDLVPGDNLNMLFQLAEATADSELDREDVSWYYLDNNQWKTLRTGFEVLDDATNGLTASGIIKFAMPENITDDNTILPKGLYWIKAAIPKNSSVVCETVGVHTQAVRCTFTNRPENDKSRLSAALAAGKITRLNEADASVKKVSQPYDSYGGRLPEDAGHFYVRASELLRHKGRAVQKFDYERMVLEAFPQIFKVKCINHSFALNAHQYKNDFPFAPGYVTLAVIPDLNQLKATQCLEPRVPVSILEDIRKYMVDHVSPFIRFRAMNPRYEKINFCVKVRLLPNKDENYYKEKLRRDIQELLAPWAVGKYEKLSFGQCINRSEVIRLLETSNYVDFILDLCMAHEDDNLQCAGLLGKTILSVCPKTPRSILIAGNIDVCISQKDCEPRREPKCPNEAEIIANYCQDPIIR